MEPYRRKRKKLSTTFLYYLYYYIEKIFFVKRPFVLTTIYGSVIRRDFGSVITSNDTGRCRKPVQCTVGQLSVSPFVVSIHDWIGVFENPRVPLTELF